MSEIISFCPFSIWLTSLNVILSKFIHVVTNGNISSFGMIYNSIIDGWMDKEDVVCIYNGIILRKLFYVEVSCGWQTTLFFSAHFICLFMFYSTAHRLCSLYWVLRAQFTPGQEEGSPRSGRQCVRLWAKHPLLCLLFPSLPRYIICSHRRQRRTIGLVISLMEEKICLPYKILLFNNNTEHLPYISHKKL